MTHTRRSHGGGTAAPSGRSFCESHAKPWCREMLLERGILEACSASPDTCVLRISTGQTCHEEAKTQRQHLEGLREDVFQHRDRQHLGLKQPAFPR